MAPTLYFLILFFLVTLSLPTPAPTVPRLSWGSTISIGGPQYEIVGLSTVLVPGAPPAVQTGSLALWPGLWALNDKNSDLIQTAVTYNGPPIPEPFQNGPFCRARPGQWCVTPYVYAAGGKPKYPLHGHAADPTDHIHISYAKDLATADGLWTQNVSIPAKNAYAPLYKVGTRKADFFATGTECQGYAPGTADKQVYTDTVITLREPDMTFVKTFRKYGPVVAEPPTTRDGGKTWTFESSTIPAMRPGTAFTPS